MNKLARHGNNGGHKNRVTKEERREITRLYHHVSVEDAVRFGESLGLQERYIIRLAESRALHA